MTWHQTHSSFWVIQSSYQLRMNWKHSHELGKAMKWTLKMRHKWRKWSCSCITCRWLDLSSYTWSRQTQSQEWRQRHSRTICIHRSVVVQNDSWHKIYFCRCCMLLKMFAACAKLKWSRKFASDDTDSSISLTLAVLILFWRLKPCSAGILVTGIQSPSFANSEKNSL